eukprot:m.65268 g.65268  ORF g.65268 m.65268 type:complete len:360 (-) comp15910_c0_seq9:2005-3084(-)
MQIWRSRDPETSQSSLGLNASRVTVSLCPLKLNRSVHVVVSQARITACSGVVARQLDSSNVACTCMHRCDTSGQDMQRRAHVGYRGRLPVHYQNQPFVSRAKERCTHDKSKGQGPHDSSNTFTIDQVMEASCPISDAQCSQILRTFCNFPVAGISMHMKEPVAYLVIGGQGHQFKTVPVQFMRLWPQGVLQQMFFQRRLLQACVGKWQHHHVREGSVAFQIWLWDVCVDVKHCLVRQPQGRNTGTHRPGRCSCAIAPCLTHKLWRERPQICCIDDEPAQVFQCSAWGLKNADHLLISGTRDDIWCDAAECTHIVPMDLWPCHLVPSDRDLAYQLFAFLYHLLLATWCKHTHGLVVGCRG